ncbi:MAG: tetraacyldisaccharide 4'-kinase [Thiobacillaceae bacterium]|nr:tetraacyldisaccharide 4'-kinase [Thiobacillaceae bacterium]
MKAFPARCLEGWCAWHALLLPLAVLFRVVAWLRRRLYVMGLLPTRRLPVPVVVVGNITAGGSGKTPLTLWLVQALSEAGWRVGVISRGYGGREAGPMAVTATSDPARVGDEPVLIARRAGVPVWIGRRRADAGRALLDAHPDVNLLIADDGLQHYALARDVEIAVVDGASRFGNGLPLPAGPLREPVGRLDAVDAVVVNGGSADGLGCRAPIYAMALRPVGLRHLSDPDRRLDLAALRGRQVHAVAGIGRPGRFFQTLRELGAEVIAHPFADHHPFRAAELPEGFVVMTAKDAVKCAAFASADTWALEVDAVVAGGLQTRIDQRLGPPHGRETA